MYSIGVHIFVEQFFVILQSTPHVNLYQIRICPCKTIHTTLVALHKCEVHFPHLPYHTLQVNHRLIFKACPVQLYSTVNVQNILHMPSATCLGHYEIKLEAQYCD